MSPEKFEFAELDSLAQKAAKVEGMPKELKIEGALLFCREFTSDNVVVVISKGSTNLFGKRR